MPHFTKKIQTGKESFIFHFDRIYTVNGLKYHVWVKHGKNTHYFMMGGGNEQWYFSDRTILPRWIIMLERQLEDAIVEHLKNGLPEQGLP